MSQAGSPPRLLASFPSPRSCGERVASERMSARMTGEGLSQITQMPLTRLTVFAALRQFTTLSPLKRGEGDQSYIFTSLICTIGWASV
jgi:hypothetical protein